MFAAIVACSFTRRGSLGSGLFFLSCSDEALSTSVYHHPTFLCATVTMDVLTKLYLLSRQWYIYFWRICPSRIHSYKRSSSQALMKLFGHILRSRSHVLKCNVRLWYRVTHFASDPVPTGKDKGNSSPASKQLWHLKVLYLLPRFIAVSFTCSRGAYPALSKCVASPQSPGIEFEHRV